MKLCGQIVSLLALVVFLLPALTAQEEKKEEKKEEKTAEKKEEPKKEPAEEKLVYGYKLGPVKLTRVDGGEFAVDVPVPDPMKIYQVNMWSAQQMQSIAQQQAQARSPQSVAQAAQAMAQYQIQLAQKQLNETTTLKPVDLRFADNMKVRANFPPVQFDDQGNLKRYTVKQLAALRGKSKWPGYYPAEADMLKPGQIVEVYISKASLPMPVKTKGPKKKGDIEADLAAAPTKPEAVLVVVLVEVIAK